MDLEREVDLIEEVARLFGYETIHAQELKGEIPQRIDQSLFTTISKLREHLVSLGLTEVQTYSFYSTKVLESLGFHEEYRKKLVKIANPMSAETEYLRMDVWPNLIEVVDKNLRQGYKDIMVFEIGKVYMAQEGALPKEEHRLSIVLTNGSDNPLQELVALFKKLDISGLTIEAIASPLPLFHPKRFVKIKKSNQMIAGMAELHPRIAHKFGFDKRVAIFEIPIHALIMEQN